jgi:hypothetical protein
MSFPRVSDEWPVRNDGVPLRLASTEYDARAVLSSRHARPLSLGTVEPSHLTDLQKVKVLADPNRAADHVRSPLYAIGTSWLTTARAVMAIPLPRAIDKVPPAPVPVGLGSDPLRVRVSAGRGSAPTPARSPVEAALCCWLPWLVSGVGEATKAGFIGNGWCVMTDQSGDKAFLVWKCGPLDGCG